MRLWTILMLTALLGAGTSLGQDAANTEDAEPTAAEKAEASRQQRRDALRERVRRAIRLPRTTEEAREEGADEEQVQEVLRTGREKGVPAGDMQEILEGENEALREGHKDNFGASVQEMKASGLRGRELADAIHAEQVARGMKKPKKNKGKGHGKGRDAHDDNSGSDDGVSDESERNADQSSEGTQGQAIDKVKSQGKGKLKSKGKGNGRKKGNQP